MPWLMIVLKSTTSGVHATATKSNLTYAEWEELSSVISTLSQTKPRLRVHHYSKIGPYARIQFTLMNLRLSLWLNRTEGVVYFH